MVEERTRTEAEPYVLPTHFPGLLTGVPKVFINRESTQSEMKDMFSVDKRRNNLESQILTLRDKGAMSGEKGNSSSSANLGRSAKHWRRLALLRSGDVEPKGTAVLRGGPSGDVSSEEPSSSPRPGPSCSSLLAHGVQFVVETATENLEWSFGSDELSFGAAGTLVAGLR